LQSVYFLSFVSYSQSVFLVHSTYDLKFKLRDGQAALGALHQRRLAQANVEQIREMGGQGESEDEELSQSLSGDAGTDTTDDEDEPLGEVEGAGSISKRWLMVLWIPHTHWERLHVWSF
jgi:hypothetical protein